VDATAAPRLADALVERPSLLGGAVCLDFVNSADPSVHAPEVDYIGDYMALVSWGRYAGAITDAEAAALLDEASVRPAEAEAVWRRAIALRAALARLFAAVVAGSRPATADLGTLNEAIEQTLSRLRVAEDGEGFAWAWDPAPGALDRILWPLVRSAAELLVSPEIERVRGCGADGCGWLFVDASKNRSRRWCGDVCGSREKARRYYRRRVGRHS
jgi:predicted RNA-binding Zn ribbon-like protein